MVSIQVDVSSGFALKWERGLGSTSCIRSSADVSSGIFWVHVQELQADISEIVDGANSGSEHEWAISTEPFDPEAWIVDWLNDAIHVHALSLLQDISRSSELLREDWRLQRWCLVAWNGWLQVLHFSNSSQTLWVSSLVHNRLQSFHVEGARRLDGSFVVGQAQSVRASIFSDNVVDVERDESEIVKNTITRARLERISIVEPLVSHTVVVDWRNLGLHMKSLGFVDDVKAGGKRLHELGRLFGRFGQWLGSLLRSFEVGDLAERVRMERFGELRAKHAAINVDGRLGLSGCVPKKFVLLKIFRISKNYIPDDKGVGSRILRIAVEDVQGDIAEVLRQDESRGFH